MCNGNTLAETRYANLWKPTEPQVRDNRRNTEKQWKPENTVKTSVNQYPVPSGNQYGQCVSANVHQQYRVDGGVCGGVGTVVQR